MLQALDVARTPSFVRVAWNHPDLIMRALDAGADGIVVPMVNSPEDARLAAGACHYAPRGFRSWGPTRSSMGESTYTPVSANLAAVCMVMIETGTAVDAIDAILAVDGVDGAFVGPADLAVSCGLPPNQDPFTGLLGELIGQVLEACRRSGHVPGIHCASVDIARRWSERGFRMLPVANDATLLSAGAAGVISEFRRG